MSEQVAHPSDTIRPAPLFVVAPLNRSGTNYLREILLCHSDVQRSFCYEDYSLAYTDALLSFANSMAKHWGPKHRAARDELLADLAATILRFFEKAAVPGRYLLLTTPRPWGVQNVFVLFPNARLLVLVRDGRNTVASACKTFSAGSVSYWARQWRKGASHIMEFCSEFSALRGDKWEFVRYEDVQSSAEATILSLLHFLDLNADGFDWDRFHAIPLWGSSEHGIGTKVQKPSEFSNDHRYKSWSRLRLMQFQWIAGRANARLQQLCHKAALPPTKPEARLSVR